MVERGEDALVDGDRTVEWKGVPKATQKDRAITLVLSFEATSDRDELVERLGISPKRKGSWTSEWPVDESELRLL